MDQIVSFDSSPFGEQRRRVFFLGFALRIFRFVHANRNDSNFTLFVHRFVPTATRRLSFESKTFVSLSFAPNVSVFQVFDRTIGGVHVRIYQPEETIELEQKTTLIYFHGGGFVLGSIETYDQATYLLANLTRTTLISVE